MTTRAVWWMYPAGLAVLLLHCNTILDNKEGFLAMPEEAGTGLPDGSAQDPIKEAGPANPQVHACASNEQLCGSTCVAQDDPTYGCGRADCTPCAMAHASAACNRQTCVMDTCNPGYADCNGQDEDGCETDLSKEMSCGGCEIQCPPSAPVCSPGSQPGMFTCTSGCTAEAPLLCDGSCIDPETDLQHCGTCTNACPTSPNATATCAHGTCQLTCDPTYHLCAGACTPEMDPSACGPTCEICPTPANAVATCVDDQCGGNCLPGFADCDALADNGCETVLATDPIHCGACGISCKGALCVDGKCQEPLVDAGADASPPVDGAAPPP